MEKKEYIERQQLINRLQSMINGISYTRTYEERQDLLSKERTLEIVKHIIRYEQSADVVPWSWLQSYADGKRCNFASDFIIEAKEAYERGEN